jgi:hypothetical protein
MLHAGPQGGATCLWAALAGGCGLVGSWSVGSAQRTLLAMRACVMQVRECMRRRGAMAEQCLL